VSTPSSGAGGISAPTDSSAGIPELPKIESPNGNVSSVINPVGTTIGNTKTLGYGYNFFGDCVENGQHGACTPSSELEKEREKQRQLAESAAGAAREAARLRLAELNAQLELRAKLGNDAKADRLFTDLKNSPLVKGGLSNKGTFAYALNNQDATDFWNGLASDLKTGQGLQVGDLDNLKWFAMNYVMQRDANNKPYYVQWDPVFGQTGSLVADLPGGSPVFLNGDAGQLNSRFGGRKWGAIGFVQSVFGGWDRSSFRAASGEAHGGPTVSFGASGCRHPSMSKPTGNMPTTDPATNKSTVTGQAYEFPINADLKQNIAIAGSKGSLMRASGSLLGPMAGTASVMLWFKDIIGYNRPWDFKNWGPGESKGGSPFENYGNFHFGAVGRAAGFSALVIHQAAGNAQGEKASTGAGSGVSQFNVAFNDAYRTSIGGSGSFGDDPKDYYWTSLGIDYYDLGCYK
jgi:Bacterial toxin 44